MAFFSSGIAQLKNEFGNIETNESKIRNFAFVVGGVLTLLGLFALYRDHIGRSEVLGGIGLMLVVLGIVHPKVLRPLYYLWMRLAVVLGVVVGSTLLTLFYFLVVTPMGLLRRLFRRTPIRNEESYWLTASSFTKESLERPF